MKLSDFEKKVTQALVKGDPDEAIILQQLAVASVINRDYAGVGVYTNMVVDKAAPLVRKRDWHFEKIPGVYLNHPNLDDGAGALLWFESGTISCLECYTYVGEWPKDEELFVIETM